MAKTHRFTLTTIAMTMISQNNEPFSLDLSRERLFLYFAVSEAFCMALQLFLKTPSSFSLGRGNSLEISGICYKQFVISITEFLKVSRCIYVASPVCVVKWWCFILFQEAI